MKKLLLSVTLLAFAAACGGDGSPTAPGSVAGVPGGPSFDIAGQSGTPATAHEDLKPGNVATSPTGVLTAGTDVQVTWTAPVSPRNTDANKTPITVTGYDIKMKCTPVKDGTCNVPKGTDNNYTGTSYAMGKLAEGTYTFEIRGLGTTPKVNNKGEVTGTEQHGSAYVQLVFKVGAAVVAKKDQFITFAVPAGHVSTYGDGHVDISSWATVKTANGEDALAAQFKSLTPTVCAVDGSDMAVITAGLGPCTIEASQPGNDAYNAAASKTVTFSIAQATQAITFAELPNKTYGEAAFTVSATGGNSGNPVTFTLAANSAGCTLDATTNTVSITGATKAGEACSVVASQLGNANYKDAVPVTRSFTIAKAATKISLTITGSPFTYDGQEHGATAVVTDASGNALPDLKATITYNGGSALPKNANTYAVLAKLDATANYTGSEAAGEIVINKATPTVTIITGGPYTYDGQTHAATVAIVGVAGETLTAPTPTYNGGSALPLNAGSYTVAAKFVGSGNYTDATAPEQTLVINKAKPTLTATGGTFPYSGLAQPGSTSATGVGGAALSAAVSYTEGATTLASAPVNAGTYTVTVRYEESLNYEAGSASATIQINKVGLSIEAVSSTTTKVYDGAPFSGTTSVRFVGFVNGEGESVLGSPVTLSIVNAAGNGNSYPGAGAYELTPSQTTARNYDITYKSLALTITQAPLTVTAAATPNTKVWDGSAFDASTFTATYSGFVNGQTAAVLGGTLGFDITSTSGKTYPAVGTYNLTPKGLTSLNYNITFAPTTLTIQAWTLNGFYAPVDMRPAGNTTLLNTVRNGSSVPLKFEVLAGSTELTATSEISSFREMQITCPNAPVVADVELTTTGGTSLRYDATAGQYVQNWQTQKKPGACYKVVVTTRDGSILEAFFQLK